MKTITIDDIRSWHPCYDPSRYLPDNWSGTALDILDMAQVPAWDRLWCVLRPEVLDDLTLRKLACLYVRQTPLADGRTVWGLLNDERSRNAVIVAEKYIEGEATKTELAAAREAAGATAWAAAEAAAWTAARDAAEAAAWTAARDAARAAAWTARTAARTAAWDWDAQVRITRDLLIEEARS